MRCMRKWNANAAAPERLKVAGVTWPEQLRSRHLLMHNAHASAPPARLPEPAPGSCIGGSRQVPFAGRPVRQMHEGSVWKRPQ
jgi:hypothetical protein